MNKEQQRRIAGINESEPLHSDDVRARVIQKREQDVAKMATSSLEAALLAVMKFYDFITEFNNVELAPNQQNNVSKAITNLIDVVDGDFKKVKRSRSN